MSKIMKRSSLVALILLAFGFASIANAEIVDYVYDFSTCNTGDILSSADDGWWEVTGSYSAGVKSCDIVSGGTGYFSGNYLDTTWTSTSASTMGLQRMNDTDWGYTLVDGEDFEMSILTNVGPTGAAMNGAVQFGKHTSGAVDNSAAWGFGSRYDSKGVTNLQWRVNGSSWNFGTFSGADYSIVKIGLTAIYDDVTSAYDVDCWYETTPGDENTRMVALSFQDQSLIASNFTGFTILVVGSSNAADQMMMDNITVSVGSVVPEPSAIALLVSGLIGLLAYAWRKRK